MVSNYRDALSSGLRQPKKLPIEDIEGALQAVVRTLNQVRVHDRLLRAAGIQVDRAGVAVLYRLFEEDALRITDLAERLAVDAPTVTRKVQQLEREELVVRRPDPLDRRVSRLSLTTGGRRTIRQVMTARRAWLTRLLAGWDAAEQADFARYLGAFAEALTLDLDTREARGS